MGDTQPPLEYLFASSEDAVEAYFLASHNRTTNIERILVDLIEQWIQYRDNERIGRSILSLRRTRSEQLWLSFGAFSPERNVARSLGSTQNLEPKALPLPPLASTTSLPDAKTSAPLNQCRIVGPGHLHSQLLGGSSADARHNCCVFDTPHRTPESTGKPMPGRELPRQGPCTLSPRPSLHPIRAVKPLESGSSSHDKSFDRSAIPMRKKLLRADEFRSCAKIA